MSRPVRFVIPAQVEIRSRLDVELEALWEAVTSAEGINFEMGPWLRFVPPAGADLLRLAASGEPLNLKIKGPLGLPLGRYPLQLKRLEQGKGFLEQTRMLPFLLWQHERTIEADGDHTLIVDRLGWQWKPAFLAPLVRSLVRAFFRHRHRKLRRRFGQEV